MSRSHVLPLTLRFIAVVQIVLGLAFLFIPGPTAVVLGLAKAPGWTEWLFGMMAARFLGFGYGMALAALEPARNLAWIKAMIGIQAVDWFVTLYYLWQGAVTLAQVTTASFLPIVFVLLMVWAYPRATRGVSVATDG